MNLVEKLLIIAALYSPPVNHKLYPCHSILLPIASAVPTLTID